MDNFLSSIIWSFLLFMFLEEIAGSGKLSIQFRRYENPGGEGDNGHCCDGRAFFCFGACDHRFLVCVDDRYGTSNMGRCPYGRQQTGVVHDADTIVFYSSIGGTRNPMLMNFNSWPGSVKVKVYVEDHDDNDNDYVDYLQTVVTTTPSKSEQAATTGTYLLRRRTKLTVDVKVYCDQGYFGPACDVFCQAQDDFSGHYTCHSDTGGKICKPGWVGEFCASSHDDCVINQCQNGATCLDSHQSYICVCTDGLTGQYCDQDIDECIQESHVCANGGSCVNSFGSYSCMCTFAWTGPVCSQPVDFCVSTPCNHGAECQSNETGYHCTCASGWSGSQCEQNVDECLEEPCFNNGTCLDTDGSFDCLCFHGTTGNLCEVNIDECASSPCNHSNATCYDLINGYHCACPAGITGTNCADELFQIQFPVMLDNREEYKIKQAIEDMLYENAADRLKDNMSLETSFGTFTSADGKNSTIVSLMVFYKGKQLDQTYLQSILTPDKVTTLKKFVNLNKEDSLQMLQKSDVALQRKDSLTEGNWVVSHWYAIVIIVMVVITLVVVPVVTYIIRKRKHKVVEVDMNAYWQSSNETPSLGFENIVYDVEHQPLRPSILEDSDNTATENTDLEMSEAADVANGGRINSFKNGKSDS